MVVRYFVISQFGSSQLIQIQVEGGGVENNQKRLEQSTNKGVKINTPRERSPGNK